MNSIEPFAFGKKIRRIKKDTPKNIFGGRILSYDEAKKIDVKFIYGMNNCLIIGGRKSEKER